MIEIILLLIFAGALAFYFLLIYLYEYFCNRYQKYHLEYIKKYAVEKGFSLNFDYFEDVKKKVFFTNFVPKEKYSFIMKKNEILFFQLVSSKTEYTVVQYELKKDYADFRLYSRYFINNIAYSMSTNKVKLEKEDYFNSKYFLLSKFESEVKTVFTKDKINVLSNLSNNFVNVELIDNCLFIYKISLSKEKLDTFYQDALNIINVFDK